MFWRVLGILVLLSGLAGCSGVNDTSSTPTRSCPGWMPGLDHFIAHEGFDERILNNPTNDTFPIAPRTLRDGGFPLDIFDIILQGPQENASRQYGIQTFDSRIEMTIFRADNNEPLLAFDLAKGKPGAKNPGQYRWTFEGGLDQMILEVRLSQPPQQPVPTALDVRYQFIPNLDGDARTVSTAQLDYSVQYQYRVC